MQTREQEYALRSHKQIQELDMPSINKVYRDQYGALCHKLPILIRTAGLTQALAFVATRKGEGPYNGPFHRLLHDLALTVGYKDGDTAETSAEARLLAASRTAHLSEYMYLTQRVLAALVWYKRFAESVLDVTADADLEATGTGPATPSPVGGTS